MITQLPNVREIVYRLGRARVMAACGASTQSITNWIANGRIPPQHYLAFRRLCHEEGIRPPDHLFFGAVA